MKHVKEFGKVNEEWNEGNTITIKELQKACENAHQAGIDGVDFWDWYDNDQWIKYLTIKVK